MHMRALSEGVRVDLVDLFDLPGHDLLHEGAIARAIYTFAVDADASDPLLQIKGGK